LHILIIGHFSLFSLFFSDSLKNKSAYHPDFRLLKSKYFYKYYARF
jgi:hypothetical protein